MKTLGILRVGLLAVGFALGTAWADPSCCVKAKAEGKDAPWHFIEVMACRGGCIGGGGQPYGCTDEVRKLRMRGIYDDDEQATYRASHQNPYITQVYKEFLDHPGSHKAHELLHTTYAAKDLYRY